MEKAQKPGNPKYKNGWSHSVRQKKSDVARIWDGMVCRQATNTKYYRHVMATLGNTDVLAMEELHYRVVWAQKILLALERYLIVLLRIRYTKSVRLGMASRYGSS
jgi:hypothetical protein